MRKKAPIPLLVRRSNAPVPEPPKHVIATYRHRDQVVLCECGWEGSSATPDNATRSEWTEHLASTRPAPKGGRDSGRAR